MKIEITFPLRGGEEGSSRNRKEIREQLLLDSVNSGVEKALFDAANAAKGPDHKVFISHSYGPKGRLSVWIVDDTGTGKVRDRTKALKEALAKVTI